MRWKVELESIKGDQRLLADLLSELSLNLVLDEDRPYLHSDLFESLETAQEVHELAREKVSFLNDIIRWGGDIELFCAVSQVWMRRPDNTYKPHTLLQVANLSSSGSIQSVECTVNGEKPTQAEKKEWAYQRDRDKAIPLLVAATKDERVVNVLQLLAGELTPFTMSHLGEIIENDMGKGRNNLVPGASVNRWKRFDRSMNHPTVYGLQARHPVSNDEPPSNPMYRDEAEHFIRLIAERWLQLKIKELNELSQKNQT